MGCAQQSGGTSESVTQALSEESISVTSASAENETDVSESVNTEENTVSDTLLTFSADSGIYKESFLLEMSCYNEDEIYYTLDGSDPAVSETRMLYTEPLSIAPRNGDKNVIAAVDPLLFSGNFSEYSKKDRAFKSKVSVPSDDAVDKCTVVRAAAKNSEGVFSESFTRTYFIGTMEEHIQGLAESCEAAGKSLAVISITMDYNDLFDSESGIYVKGSIWDKELEKAIMLDEHINDESARKFDANYKQKGREWEKECHIDMFEASPESTVLAFEQDCGIRIQGNYSRSDLQKGFRLYARKDYGAKRFDYPVFGDSTDVSSFKTLVLRSGGNCAFTAKFNDTYWQTIVKDMDCSVQTSRPCVVYINGEYFGLYVLQEDYSEHYFADHYGVNADDVVVYKGDAEKYERKFYLDEGTLPEGVTDEGYFYNELFEFFRTHSDLKNDKDFEEFSEIVDTESVKDYFLAQVWINNKWDWPGKNWSMWKTAVNDGSEYGDGRWRFLFYDMEFGGVSGSSDIKTNTVKEDNYITNGLLNRDTNNPAVLCYAYLMTNESFKNEYCEELLKLSEGAFSKKNLSDTLMDYINVYSPLYEQFFERYPGSGSAEEAIQGGYASALCISDFIDGRAQTIPDIVAWIERKTKAKE
ncbi:MAG: CotH kinase family protein [Huintestinicola sp.]